MYNHERTGVIRCEHPFFMCKAVVFRAEKGEFIMETIIIIIGAVNAVLLIIILIKLFTGTKAEIDAGSIISSVKDGLSASQRELREEMSGSVQASVKTMGDNIVSVQKTIGEGQTERLAQTEKQLTQMQNDVTGKLDVIREVVDERLQRTLDDKMTRFSSALSAKTRDASGGATGAFFKAASISSVFIRLADAAAVRLFFPNIRTAPQSSKYRSSASRTAEKAP